MTAVIKIFGERNTSTTALKKLVEANSASRVAPSSPGELNSGWTLPLRVARKYSFSAPLRERLVDGIFHGRPALEAWKHAATDFEDIDSLSGHLVIFCVRHPASWALGLFRRPYHVPGPVSPSLDAFLARRWQTLGRERLDRAEMSAMEIYNAKMAAYADLQAQLDAAGTLYCIVRHEDFATDQEGVFGRVALFLDGPSTTFRPLDTSTKDGAKTRDYYKVYYGERRWLDEIDVDSASRIREATEWAGVGRYGYEPI